MNGTSDSHLIDPSIYPGLAALLRRCTPDLYEAIGHPNAPTACIFTSLILADALTALGHGTRVMATVMEGQAGNRRLRIGHPDDPITRPGEWQGHVVCMVGNVLIDPTMSHARRFGMDAPLLVAVRADRPWVPEARCEVASGTHVTWRSEGANPTWTTIPDADPARRPDVVARLLKRLRAPDAPAPHGQAA